MSLILGTGRTRPPRELAIVLAVGLGGTLVAWLFAKALDFALLAAGWNWRP